MPLLYYLGVSGTLGNWSPDGTSTAGLRASAHQLNGIGHYTSSWAYEKPGFAGEYAHIRLHAGLVCINAPGGLNLALQKQLFKLILDDLAVSVKAGRLDNIMP